MASVDRSGSPVIREFDFKLLEASSIPHTIGPWVGYAEGTTLKFIFTAPEEWQGRTLYWRNSYTNNDDLLSGNAATESDLASGSEGGQGIVNEISENVFGFTFTDKILEDGKIESIPGGSQYAQFEYANYIISEEPGGKKIPKATNAIIGISDKELTSLEAGSIDLELGSTYFTLRSIGKLKALTQRTNQYHNQIKYRYNHYLHKEGLQDYKSLKHLPIFPITPYWENGYNYNYQYWDPISPKYIGKTLDNIDQEFILEYENPKNWYAYEDEFFDNLEYGVLEVLRGGDLSNYDEANLKVEGSGDGLILSSTSIEFEPDQINSFVYFARPGANSRLKGNFPAHTENEKYKISLSPESSLPFKGTESIDVTAKFKETGISTFASENTFLTSNIRVNEVKARRRVIKEGRIFKIYISTQDGDNGFVKWGIPKHDDISGNFYSEGYGHSLDIPYTSKRDFKKLKHSAMENYTHKEDYLASGLVNLDEHGNGVIKLRTRKDKKREGIGAIGSIDVKTQDYTEYIEAFSIDIFGRDPSIVGFAPYKESIVLGIVN